MAIDYDEPAHRWRSNAKHFWPNALWPRLGLPVWGCASLRVCVCVLWLRLWLNWDIGRLPRIAATDTRQSGGGWGESSLKCEARWQQTISGAHKLATGAARQQWCNSAADYLGPVPANVWPM